MNESKVGFMLADTGNEFNVLSTQEDFDDIEDSKGIIKLAYAVDDTNHNNKEDNETVHNDQNPVVVLNHVITRIALSKCESTPQSHHYYEGTVHKFKMNSITSSDLYRLIYDTNKYLINTRLGKFGYH